MTIIFKKILEGSVFDHRQFVDYLSKHSTGSWLIRESQVPGMVTVEKIMADKTLKAHRFAFMDGKWVVLLDDKLSPSVLSSISYEYLTAESNSSLRQHQLLESLLSVLFHHKDFPREKMITPESRYVSHHYLFSGTSFAIQDKKHTQKIIPQLAFFKTDKCLDRPVKSVASDAIPIDRTAIDDFMAKLFPDASHIQRSQMLKHNPLIERLVDYLVYEEYRQEDFYSPERDSSCSSGAFFNKNDNAQFVATIAEALLLNMLFQQEIQPEYLMYLNNNPHFQLSAIWRDGQSFGHDDKTHVYEAIV